MQLLPIVTSVPACPSSVPGDALASGGPLLLAQLLAEQQRLTAVEQFAAAHDYDNLARREQRYRSLMPASPPGPGQQYAFEVDLDRCSGCKSCVVACHSLNGLDEHEAWRDVGLLIGGTRAAPVMQHVTAACHHCIQPACMAACPVNAYEKDRITGIVKHLDDQCFGCQYCILACPYEVPKYHPRKGIVRKCDMCSSRLAVGEAPACVQSCPHDAIAIRVVSEQQVVEDAEAANFLPAAPDPQITLPTTSYKTKKVAPRNLLPADYYSLRPQHAHAPLVVMLVLTQLSVGAFIASQVLAVVLPREQVATIGPLLAINALAFGLLAISASVFHLGRPLFAFRALLGLRHSWLSREIVAFGAFAGLAIAQAGTVLVCGDSSQALASWLGWGVCASGVVALQCSIMIYVITQREMWSFSRVALRFVLTTALLGVAAVWLSILGLAVARPSTELGVLVSNVGPPLCRTLIVLAGAKLLVEASIFRHLPRRQMTPLRRSALLMTRELSSVTVARFATGILGGLLIPAMLLACVGDESIEGSAKLTILAAMLFAACLAGELLERYLFFVACVTPRMPGSIS